MIDHIAWATLAVSDQDVMREFFVDVPGFRVTTDEEMWPGARWLEVAPPGAQTGVGPEQGLRFDRDPDAHYPIGLQAADLQAVVEAANEHGYAATEPVTEPWGSFLRVSDPEGRQLLIRARA